MPAGSHWEGPARAIVVGALAFPAHASLWFEGNEWGGTLYIDAYAPLYALDDLQVELELRGNGLLGVRVEAIEPANGVQSHSATLVRFVGIDPLNLPRDPFGGG